MSSRLIDGLARRLGRRAVLGGAVGMTLAALGGETAAKCGKKCKQRKREALIANCQNGLPGLFCPGCYPGRSAFCDLCLATFITRQTLSCCAYAPYGMPTVESCLCQYVPACAPTAKTN